MHKQLAATMSKVLWNLLQRQIDQMIYKLYDLTEAEIAVIEESVKA